MWLMMLDTTIEHFVLKYGPLWYTSSHVPLTSFGDLFPADIRGVVNPRRACARVTLCMCVSVRLLPL